MWSQNYGKNAMLVHEVTLKNKCKKVKTHKTLKLEIEISKQFYRHIKPFFAKSETTF